MSAGICDVDDVCDGVSTVCTNVFMPPTTVCRAAATGCDVEERCTGSTAPCPADAFRPRSFPCRTRARDCDPTENCPGDSVICPPDVPYADFETCTPAAACMLGVCMGGGCTALPCTTTVPCTMATCVAGVCMVGGTMSCDAGFARRDAGSDASVDADLTMDAGSDAGSGLPCGGAVCPCPRPAHMCANNGDCPTGQLCLASVCGERDCVDGGTTCGTAADCPPGSTCVGGVCASSSGCTDSRDCPLGFGCEPSGAGSECVDRRVPCSEPDECPYGFVCYEPGPNGAGFCRRVATRCESPVTCQSPEVCVDVDGDGASECQIVGSCTTNGDCAAAEVCGVSPSTQEAECGPFGPCGDSSECPTVPMEACERLAPGGLPECAVPGGACVDDTDCPIQQVCASLPLGQPTRCVSGRAVPTVDAGTRFDAGPDVVTVTGGGCVCRAGGGERGGASLTLAGTICIALGLRARRRRVSAP